MGEAAFDFTAADQELNKIPEFEIFVEEKALLMQITHEKREQLMSFAHEKREEMMSVFQLHSADKDFVLSKLSEIDHKLRFVLRSAIQKILFQKEKKRIVQIENKNIEELFRIYRNPDGGMLLKPVDKESVLAAQNSEVDDAVRLRTLPGGPAKILRLATTAEIVESSDQEAWFDLSSSELINKLSQMAAKERESQNPTPKKGSPKKQGRISDFKDYRF